MQVNATKKCFYHKNAKKDPSVREGSANHKKRVFSVAELGDLNEFVIDKIT